MGLYISLTKKKTNEVDFDRFRSAFFIFNSILKNAKKEGSQIVFYQDFPIQEINKDFKRIEFNFGLLESSFRKKLNGLKEDSITAGFEIETDIHLAKEKFKLVFCLLPRNKSNYYDIILEILPNGNASSFEDLEQFYKEFRNKILDDILDYNEKVQKKEKHLSQIRRAVISEHRKEFHDIANWVFFYSKEPEEFINHISYGNKEIRERLSFANRQKFSEQLTSLNLFVYKLFEYAKESEVKIKEGSIAIIPKNRESMKVFVNKMRNKISLVAKENYPTIEEFNQSLHKIFSN